MMKNTVDLDHLLDYKNYKNEEGYTVDEDTDYDDLEVEMPESRHNQWGYDDDEWDDIVNDTLVDHPLW